MAVHGIEHLLEAELVSALRRVATIGLPDVPRQLVVEKVAWDSRDVQPVQLTVLDSGALELDVRCDARELRHESTAWGENSFIAAIEGHGTLRITEAVAREIRPAATSRTIRIHGISWQLGPARRTERASSEVWFAPIDFGIADEPHLLDLGSGNLAVRSEDQTIKGWCFETMKGRAFLVRSIDRMQWYLALVTSAGPRREHVLELTAFLAFALGQPFAVGVFHRVDGENAYETARLSLPDWRSRHPNRRAPGLPAIAGGHWLPHFVALGIKFLADEPSAPLLTAIHHSLDSVDGILDTEFLHTWIAAELLSKWGMKQGRFRDGSTPRIADHEAWIRWVSAHEAEIKALAADGMQRQLLDRVRESDAARPTPVQRVLIGEGIPWTDDLQQIELARHGVTHEGTMSDSKPYDAHGNLDKLGLALNVLGTLIARLIGYEGPLSDRSTRSLPLSADSAPRWWKAVHDYNAVKYCDGVPGRGERRI